MSEVIGDALTALNQARFQMADDSDKVRAENMTFYRTHAQAWVNGVYKEYGDDGVGAVATYGAAFVASAGEVLLDFVQGVGASTFIDPLRLGAGVKKGGWGYVEDVLRVVGVAGGALKLLKFAKFLGGASRVGVGLGSCLPTSAAKALRFAGIKALPTVEELAQGTMNVRAPFRPPVSIGPTFVRNPIYPGATFAEVIPNLVKAGATVESKAIGSLKDLTRLVDQGKGPVVFGVRWAGGGGHAMMAYRPYFGSGIRLADQFGNMHTLVKDAQGLKVVAGAAASDAHLIGGAGRVAPGTVIGVIDTFMPQAHVVKDSVILQALANAPLAQRVGVPLYQAIDKQFWPKVGFGASLLSTAPLKLRNVGDHVRKAIADDSSGADQQRSVSGSASTSIPVPKLSRTLQQDSILVLGELPQNGDSRELAQLEVETGLPRDRLRDALLQLARSGLIQVLKWSSQQSQLTPIMVRRVIRK